ncbi:MAG: hypothetical protein MMC23_001139 [Stictis urceolatum]|nr:hypothetical protein [Stictis urceolata]
MPQTATAQAAASTRSLPPHPNQQLLLSQSQWLFKEEDLQLTPSVAAGLNPNQERENRAKGVNFILQVGIMLRLPQITLASASVFLHRFFMRRPMIDDKANQKSGQHYYSVAATCLFLATKVEENCRKMKELVVACVRVAQKNPNKVVDEQDKEFWRWRDTILQMEDLLLETLCFDLSLEPPYTPLFHYLNFFEVENNKPLRNAAWAFLNDSCLTPLCLLWPGRTIAAAALYAAARHVGVNFLDDKRGKPWWEVIDVKLLDLKKACNYMASIYENAPLRGGVEENIYTRTPEDGDSAGTRTRQVRPAEDIETASQDSRRRTSTASAAGSDVSRKRAREDEGELKEGTEAEKPPTTDDREAKRQKITNGASKEEAVNGAKDGNSGPPSPAGSEEGEVDE